MEHCGDLIRLGYHPVPINQGSKRPALKAWQDLRMTAEDCAPWEDHGTGILCGVGEHPLIAVDIDVGKFTPDELEIRRHIVRRFRT